MKLIVVAIRDRQLDAFMRPFCVPAIGAAIRGFQDELNRSADDNPMYKHPEDYDLYHLAYYDEQHGKFTHDADHPKQVAVGTNLVQK